MGGFYGSLIIILYLFGEFFSSRLLAASIANSFYMQKKRRQTAKQNKYFEGGTKDVRNEASIEGSTKLNNKAPTSGLDTEFVPIELNTLLVLTDPIFRSFCCGKSLFDCFKSTRRQNQLLAMAETRFSDELDIEKLLLKLRNSYDVTKNMVKKEYRSLLAFQRGRVIDPDIEDGGSSPDISSTEEDLDRESSAKVLTFNDHVKLSVVRGMQLEELDKERMKTKIRQKEQVDQFLHNIKKRTIGMREQILSKSKYRDSNMNS